jgi:hypothetical protein
MCFMEPGKSECAAFHFFGSRGRFLISRSKLGGIMKVLLVFAFLGSFSFSTWAADPSAAPFVGPNQNLTPGALCNPSDPNFSGYDYPEKIARCTRNIAQSEKIEDAKLYGDIPQSDWKNYEFDHLLPLCAGGSNNIKNLWPQPIAEAKKKDVLEVEVCTKMRAGVMKQADAVAKIYAWFASQTQAVPSQMLQVPFGVAKTRSITCLQRESFNTEGDSKLTVKFEQVSENEIRDLRMSLLESDGDHEIIRSPETILLGENVSSRKPPIAGMRRYLIQDKQDRFEIYLPAKLANGPENFVAFASISFDGTHPKLISLECK